ncbi:MAG: hypothetical protein ACRDYC_09590, partial [Acidimicrobiales bacterium]
MSRGWLLVPAAVALGLAFWSAVSQRRRPLVGSTVAALAVQTLLRSPGAWFHGFTAIVAAVAVLPLLASAYHLAGRTLKRRCRWTLGGLLFGVLAGGVPLALGAWAAEHPVSEGVSAAKTALQEVGQGGGGGASAELASAASRFSRGQQLTGAWWSVIAELVPVEAQTRRALSHATDAGQGVARVAGEVADQLSAVRSSYHDGTIDLSLLPP